MCWNDGYERRKFEARQKKQAEEYRALGMTEEQIKEMYEFDLEQYKSDRRYHMHTQPFTSSDFDDGEDDDSESTLLNKFFDELTLTIDSRSEQSRYWWIEEIDNPKLAETIKTLSPEQIELLTLVVIDLGIEVHENDVLKERIQTDENNAADNNTDDDLDCGIDIAFAGLGCEGGLGTNGKLGCLGMDLVNEFLHVKIPLSFIK